MAGVKQKPMDQAMPNDVGMWGEKDVSGAYAGPLSIAGEQVDVDKLPALSSSDKRAASK